MDHTANRVSFTSPDWVDEMLVLINWAPKRPDGPVVRRKQLVVSRATGRRGTVLSVDAERVCLSYNDDDARARRQFDHEAFHRLYRLID